MKFKPLSILLSIFIFPTILFSQQNKDGLYHFIEARKALEKKDIDNYFISIRQAYKLRPDHPAIIRHMAKAFAIKDSLDKSYHLLSRIWEMGLQTDIESDSDFDSLKKDKRYALITKRLALNKLPLLKADTAFIIPEKGLITEGITFDSQAKCFYVGSVRKGRILKFQDNRFISYLKGIENVGSILGFKVDPKRRVLWICATFLPQYENYADSLEGKTALIKYDLKREQILKKYTIKKDKQHHSFGDLAISSKGDVFVTDSESRKLYYVSNAADSLQSLNLFPSASPPFSLQGVAFSEDERYLYVADYLNGIYRIDFKKKSSLIVSHPPNITTVGIDGLYFYKNSLIAIQNGVEPNRVVRFNLDKSLSRITSQRYLEANHPAFDEPTLGVITGEYFYFIASSQWSKMDGKGKWLDEKSLKEQVVLKVLLNNRRP